ncbi:MAG: T9SS type A sorting domain-containing protein [Ignavibacteriales bacterium]|nr:T9SS type A sorting domain-containing protein [Ignavibacteriales bacterium]
MIPRLIVTLCIIAIVKLQAQWFWQSPFPQGNTLNAVQVLDEQTVYAIGEYGAAIKTTNAGQTWKQLNIPNDNLTAIYFVNHDLGFLLGTNGTFYKTTNGGVDWNALSIKFPNNYFSIYFINENVGFMCGTFGYILKTTDGGTTWNKKNSKAITTLNKIVFVDAQIGMAVGKEGTVCRTSDGGETWKGITLDLKAEFKSIFFVDKLNGWILSDYGSVYATLDGGINWALRCSNCVSSAVGFWFFDRNNGRVFGADDYTTTDGGKTWKMFVNTDNKFKLVSFYKSLRGWAIGNNGLLAYTTDGGATWQYLVKPKELTFLYRVFFIDEKIGWIITSAYLMKTTDGGLSWKKFLADRYTRFLYFINEKEGVVISDAKFKNTSDGGETWVENKTLDNKTLLYDAFANGSNLWLYDIQKERIFYSTDIGKSIADTISCPLKSLCRIFFLDRNIGWVIDNMGMIAKTNDGGNTWTILPKISNNGGQVFVTSIYFKNENRGWITTTHGDITQTYDGGISWNTEFLGQGKNLSSLLFSSPNIGWAVGGQGLIMKTTDGGIKWQELSKTTSNELLNIFFVNGNTGWIVGNNSTILKTTNEGGTGINTTTGVIPTTFMLSQNYPNPFNPETTIEYTIPIVDTKFASITSRVTLKVYDVLGREVATLVDEFKSAGNYKVVFNPASSIKNPASGVYFYRLSAGGYNETRKMILLK